MNASAVRALMLFFTAAVFSGCAQPRHQVSAELNRDASLVGNLPANPLQWKVISSSIDTNRFTISTLYGNDIAVAYARTHTEHDYSAGAILSLVTWSQKEDSRWYGAQIPSHAQSVEFLFVTAAPGGRPQYSYQQFTGSPLMKSSADETSAPNPRVAYILSQRAAVLP
jgi:hypothetical protein